MDKDKFEAIITPRTEARDSLPFHADAPREKAPKATLFPQHLADLRRSGLTDGTIRALKFYSATREEAAEILSFSVDSDCLAFPFYSHNGQTPFVRFKPDVPFVNADGKPAKYLSPKGADNRLYIPRQTGLVFGDAHAPLFVTEGEKKAAMADQEGFPCVGLTGVSCWRQKPRDADGRKIEDAASIPIADLDLITWRGRTVYLTFDSDVATKPEVRRELWALRCELVRRGATVRVVYLPGGDSGEKCGLDDFLIAQGPEALRELLDNAPVLDWLHRAQQIVETPEGSERVDALRGLVADLVADRDADPLTRGRVRQELVKAKIVSATDFDRQAKYCGGAAVAEDTDAEPVLTATLPNLVDLVLDSEGAVAFLLKENGGLIVVSHYTDSDGTRYAPPPRDKIPFSLADADTVMRHYQTDPDGALFDDLAEYHRGISDLPEAWYSLLAAWDFHTWLLECGVNYSPILVFYAVAERGKTRTLNGVSFVAYRSMVVESLRESNIFRHAHNFGGTIAFDVMNLWSKCEKAGSEDLLLKRYERGALVPRVLRPEAGAFRDTDFFRVFGPTMIATNEAIHHILDTRSLILTMQETSRRFPDDVTPEAAIPLRARLTAFRARHLGERLPEAEKPIGGRLGDITRPLIQMIRLVKPKWEAELVALIHCLDRERKADRSETIDGQIVTALLECAEDLLLDDRLRVADVAEKLNEERPEGKKLPTAYVGRKLRALGFQKGAGTGEARTILYDSDLVGKLACKYGLSNGGGIPSESPSVPSEPSEDSADRGSIGGLADGSYGSYGSAEGMGALPETYTHGEESLEDDDVEVFRP